MSNKKVIIIGASSGIGKEMALLYAKQNHQVAITARRADLLCEIKTAFPNNIITAAFDVRGQENILQLDRLIKELNGLDLLIYNAGYGEPSERLDWTIDKATIETNIVGFTEIINHAFNYFLTQGKGQLAITSSLAALRGNSWAPAYSASKAFMSNYAEGINIKARKLRTEILVTDIKPGFIATKMAKGNGQFWVAKPEKAAAQIVQAIERKERVVYITRRWWLIAQVLKVIPYSWYRRIG